MGQHRRRVSEGPHGTVGEHQLPPLPRNIGRVRQWNTINGRPQVFTVLDEVLHSQSTNPSKVFCLQQLRREEDRRIEYRFGYYMIGVRPRMAGKWTWGQFAPMLPQADFQALVRAAQKKGWLR
jgi:hypothetical protein